MRDKELTNKFMTSYSRNKERSETLSKAYELAEKEWKRKHGERFYKSYESFKSAKSYHVRKSGRLV